MLTAKQADGARKIKQWLKLENKQIFTLAGYAGTGKSYMTNYVISDTKLKKDEVAFCTFTGKASLVLMRYHEGKTRVSTIHKLIYDFVEDEEGEIEFFLKKELHGIKLIIVDEISMVNSELLSQLRSFGLPILAIGDHGQLPAIGNQNNLLQNPDFILDEIMRQAEDNSIIYLSKLIREGKKIETGQLGDNVYILSKNSSKVDEKLLLRADQVICGYNNTRNTLNRKMRNALGMDPTSPQFGDKVILTRNNWSLEVDGFNYVNGMIGYIKNEPYRFRNNKIKMEVWEVDVQPEFLDGIFYGLNVPIHDFKGEKINTTPWQNKFINRMEYGYAITCHKAQGSQWDNVLVWNEPFGDEPWRWSYTAVTRAGKGLILAI